MKVSWRKYGDPLDTFPHSHTFIPGERFEGKSPQEFLLHLIRCSPAVGIAFNDKPIWKSSEYVAKADDLVARVLSGEPREAPVLVVIDYNVQGDWIDEECPTCYYVSGHKLKCETLWARLDAAWASVGDSTEESATNIARFVTNKAWERPRSCSK